MTGFDAHGLGGICLVHGHFAGHRCEECIARERERAARRPGRRLERVLGWLFR